MPSVDEKSGHSDGADSDGSMSWEEFFGTTTAEDLVPTLLSMYDALVGRPRCRPHLPPPPPPPRPLSVTSIASSSSSSSSSVTSSSSGTGRRLVKGSAYLASIESLDDSEDEAARRSNNRSLGESGVCSPCSFISSPSPPHTRPRYCDPHLSYMDRVVMEIVETEGVYVNDLGQVIIGYLERWEGNPDSPLTETQLAHLFSNLRQIYNFNSGFLRELEQCGLDPVKVARAFVRNNAGFTIYTEYCTNYPRTVSVLTELMRQESSARLFRERQAFLQHTLPLGSYLLKPVQRILKYHLLLQNIVKNLEGDAEGYGSVVDALSTMTAIAHHINEMKRKHEHAVRVQEIQSLLLNWQGEDLTTFGELCAEGTFRMAGAKALRHAFLFDQILLITKKKEEGILGYKAHIMCSNLMLIESVPGEPLSFHVIPFDNPRHQYTLQARNMEQKREWTLQLKRVILENYNAVIPSHARQLVMQLGQNRSDDEIVAERGTPKKQHSAPEYLERRKQERRKSETGLRARLRPRPRKSDTSISSCIKAQQRFRRNSQYRGEDSAMLPTESKPEQCGGLRRKSEPGCFSNSTTREDERSELHISEQNLCEQSEEKKSVEEIVSQLLLQNKEFQRVLKKQMTRRHRAETSDEEGDYDNLRGVWPTCPEVWLKRQREHMPTCGKAGSLPRGFPRPPPRPSPDRPFTIASDKPRELEDMERYESRFPLDDTTEEETTPHASTNNLEIHPEYRIYRPSLTRASLRQVVASVGGKLASLRLSSETLDRDQQSEMPIYKQGSSGMGARIAHATASDYADPRTLFPTPPRKAASLLGLRPPSLHSSSSSGYSSKKHGEESDASGDSFYEKSFEAIESVEVEVSCRDSAIFSDLDEPAKPAPPPVPEKPSHLKLKSPDEECDSSSVASTIVESHTTTKGWVKHVICKIQGDTNH